MNLISVWASLVLYGVVYVVHLIRQNSKSLDFIVIYMLWDLEKQKFKQQYIWIAYVPADLIDIL